MNLFEKARRYYEKGWWKLAQLEALAAKGLLTERQVAEIMGAELPDTTEEPTE